MKIVTNQGYFIRSIPFSCSSLCKFIQFKRDGFWGVPQKWSEPQKLDNFRDSLYFESLVFSKRTITPKHSCKIKNCAYFSFSRGYVQFTTGGGHRIRTCGGFHLNGFQDRRFKPLSQSSKHLNYTLFFSILQVVLYCFIKKKVRKKFY